LAERLKIYRETLERNGHDPATGHVTLLLHTFVVPNLDEAREKARQPLYRYMKSSLGLMGISELHPMNAAKNLLAAVINCVAALWFIAAGLIDWPRAAVLTGVAECSSFLAAHYSQRVPPHWVRRAVVVIGLAIAAAQFWKQFIA
jgi:alkanesulfonate monooxygenase SsuD/methylene tetrahydromethanopterin reductase-like flavin-dependent oxidoreductase (luciferase family)